MRRYEEERCGESADFRGSRLRYQRSPAHARGSLVDKRPSRGPPRSYPGKIDTTSSGSSSDVDYGASLTDSCSAAWGMGCGRAGNLGGAAMTAGHGKGHWWRQRTPLGRTCPQTGLFIHMPGRLIHTRLPGAGAPSPPRACRSVGVQELAQRPDVPPEIVVVGHLALDLLAAVQHRP